MEQTGVVHYDCTDTYNALRFYFLILFLQIYNGDSLEATYA